MASVESNSHGALAALATAFGLLLLTLVIAQSCATSIPVAPNEWDDDRWGPLVPHDTFPGDCGICHVPDRWDRLRPDFEFDHLEKTGVPLAGAHAQAACLRCHNDRGPVKLYTARGCAGCHIDVHESTLGRDCAHCHSELNWYPIGLIAEHGRTRFPLVGAHLGTACERCHQGARTGDFLGAPTECHVCHGDETARATNPNHIANGFTRDCQLCHSPTAWRPSFFNHQFFALTGRHATANCVDCHPGGRYRGTPTDCYSCHQNDYQTAQNPNHLQANFPTSCETCHTTNGWRPATFDHSVYFPITSGKHGNLNCVDCHISPPNYKVFSCINCHQHRQSNVDPDHKDVRGYVYSSAACYQCHPRGN